MSTADTSQLKLLDVTKDQKDNHLFVFIMEVWLLAVVIISLMQVNVQNYKRHLCYSFSLLFASLVCFVCFFATLVTQLSIGGSVDLFHRSSTTTSLLQTEISQQLCI